MSDYLSIQARPDPSGGLHCFLVSKQNLNPFYWWIKICQKKLQMRKLRPPKVEGVKNSKKQTIEHYKAYS